MARVNRYRALAALPPLKEEPAWTAGAALHAQYMVKEDEIAHFERTSSPWYTAAGDAAGRNGNLFAASVPGLGYRVPIDRWMAGPFHMLGLLDPRLARTGYADYGEVIGNWRFGAVMDVIRGRSAVVGPSNYPVYYPRQGGDAFLLSYSGDEYPDPLTPCAGFQAPTGAPIALQLGSGDVDPRLQFASLLRDGQPVSHCAYDAVGYTNSDAAARSLGRQIMDNRDAVVLIPEAPLVAGSSYRVSMVVDGETYSWSFRAVAGN